jgi:uncharacterized membrane protein YccF (DUF307 family)
MTSTVEGGCAGRRPAAPGSRGEIAGRDAVRLLLNILGLVFAGFWIAIGHAVAALIPASPLPFGRAIVSVDEARVMGFPPLIPS